MIAALLPALVPILSQTRTVPSAARAAWVAIPTWKLPVAVVVMRRLVLSQPADDQGGN